MAFLMSNSRPPTVSEIVGAIDVRPVILPPPTSSTTTSSSAPSKQDGYAPTYHNIDVLWKPTLGGRKISRTISTDSNDDELRRVSITELGPSSPTTTSPTMIPDYTDFATDKGMAVGAAAPRVRRMSLSEMIFGSPGQRRFTWSEKTVTEDTPRKASVTEDARFKDIMRHHNRVLNDEGGISAFKSSDYRGKE